MSLSASHLSFSYPDQPVLSGVNFEIKPGEFVGIIGPNGGGKSTLLELLMGFLIPSSGSISIAGQPPRRQRPHMGLVPQNFQYDRQFPISVLDVVLTGRLAFAPMLGSYSIEDKRIAHELLEKVGMKRYIHAPFSDLSGGQMQRVLLARALVSFPRFLFLDEATSNIDKATAEAIYELLNELKGQMTILLVTHDLYLALKYVDRMLLVENQVTPLSKDEVCKHFAIGLYHPPLKKMKREKES